MKVRVTKIHNMAALLQDNRVSDADLLEALVEEFHPGLYVLAYSILLNSDRAWQALVQALATIVAHRREYWGEPSLPVWINRLVLEQCRKAGRFSHLNALERSFSREKRPAGFLSLLASMEEAQRIVLALRYGQALALEDISAILDVPLTRVQIHLKGGRKAAQEFVGFGDRPGNDSIDAGVSHTAILEGIEQDADGLLDTGQHVELEQHLGECPACRGKATALQELEDHLRAGFSDLTEASEATGERESLAAQSLRLLPHLQRTRRLSISTRQLLLTLLLVAVLASLGWRFVWPQFFPVQPPHTPTAPPPTATPDPWVGYHKFELMTLPEDTLESLAEATGLSVEDILALNNLPPSARLNTGNTLTLAMPEEAFVPPAMRDEIALPPRLTVEADSTEIRQRLAQAGELFSTLWADYLFVYYGPAGYGGSPYYEFRNQYWLTQGGYSVQIGGDVSGQYVLNFYEEHYFPNGLNFYQAPFERPSARRVSNQADGFLFMILPFTWFGGNKDQIDLQVIGTDQVLGRPALVVDWPVENPHQTRRMWVDAERGLILRQRIYAIHGEQWTTIMEMGFTALVLDEDLPVEVFSPFKFKPDGFVRDQMGDLLPEDQQGRPFTWSIPLERRRMERLSPPPGFNPAQETLTMQWPSHPLDEWDGTVEVFAGQYFLGEFNVRDDMSIQRPFNNSESSPFDACTRSPDGRLVALSNSLPLTKGTKLFWFHLENPEDVQMVPISSAYPNEFVFDPGSRFLAYYACPSDGCGVQLTDTYTNKTSLLLRTGRGVPYSLTWSPDGRYLAMVGFTLESTMRKIIIVDRVNSVLVYQADYGWMNPKVPDDLPTLTWGRPFPRESDYWLDFYGCVVPYAYPSPFAQERLE